MPGLFGLSLRHRLAAQHPPYASGRFGGYFCFFRSFHFYFLTIQLADESAHLIKVLLPIRQKKKDAIIAFFNTVEKRKEETAEGFNEKAMITRPLTFSRQPLHAPKPLREAVDALKHERYEEALAIYQALERESPQTQPPTAFFSQVFPLMKLNRFGEALALLEANQEKVEAPHYIELHAEIEAAQRIYHRKQA